VRDSSTEHDLGRMFSITVMSLLNMPGRLYCDSMDMEYFSDVTSTILVEFVRIAMLKHGDQV
jgi:hypothetical protein